MDFKNENDLWQVVKYFSYFTLEQRFLPNHKLAKELNICVMSDKSLCTPVNLADVISNSESYYI